MLPRLPRRPRLADRRHLAPGAAAFAAATVVALLGLRAGAESPTGERPPPEPHPGRAGTVKLRLLGVNDFHGHLEPPEPGAGGAAWLAAHLDKATLPGRTIRVHAGDMVGASPLISSHFHDEPSVEVGNQIGFDVGTVGNHEFDEGGEELLRLLRGGRRTGPAALKRDARGRLANTSAPGFEGTRYPYVAANTIERDGGLLLPPYQVVRRRGVALGFIGVTTPSTPRFVLPRHSERFRFTDISAAVNRWVPELRRRGVEAIVVLAHAGARTQTELDSDDATGEIVEEARQMSDAVDVVIAGHSHSELDLRLQNASGAGDKLVVEARSYGTAYDLLDIEVDRQSGEVVAKAASVPRTGHEQVGPDRAVGTLVGSYASRIAPLADRIVAETPAPLTRSSGELGRLAADAQREFAAADLAFVNTGSLRADLPAGPLTYAELFEAQSYDHRILRLELSGSELQALLAGVEGSESMYVSGLSGEPGAGAVLAGGRALRPRATYAVAANELLASGRPFRALGSLGGRPAGSEVEALAWYLERQR